MNKCVKVEAWLVDELVALSIDNVCAFTIGVIESCVNREDSPEKIVDDIKSVLASFDEAGRIRRKSHEA